MKFAVRFWLGAYSTCLLALLGWALWVSAAESTNVPTGREGASVAPAPSVQPLSEGAERVLTLGLRDVPLLQREVLGEPLWKYLASVGYILLALYSARLINWLVSSQLKRWASRTETRFDDVVLEIAHGPIKVVAFVIFLHIGLRLFVWSPWVAEYLSKGLRIVVAWSITYMLLKGIDLLLGFWKQRAAADADAVFNDQLFPVIRRVVRVIIILAVVLFTADNLGFKITSILAGLSIGGLALGLAAQDTVANLFGAVAIFMDKPFKIGDRVVVEGIDGMVETIGLRSTRVRNLDGHLVTIPNKTMGNAIITNISLRPSIRTILTVGVTYDTSPAKVQEATNILEEVYKSDPMTGDVVISFNQFADSSLGITVVHWWNSTDWKAYMAGMQRFNLAIKERFDRAGIGFAFPTRTLYVKQDSDWKVRESARE